MVNERSNLLKELQEFNSITSLDMAQKDKIRWAIEGDENSKFFHGTINKKRSQLAICGVLVEGDWIVEPFKTLKERFLMMRLRERCGILEPTNRLAPMGLPSSFIVAMGSILVNGSPTSEFKFSKGLKQEDPLSPFLFILIMESLHMSFDNVVNAWLYNGIHIADSLSLSHLFYAEDVVFVCKWNLSNLSTIVNVLKWFFLALYLKINLHKVSSWEMVYLMMSWFQLLGRLDAQRSTRLLIILGLSNSWCSWSSRHPLTFSKRSPWLDIVREFKNLSKNGMDLLSLVKKKVGNGDSTSFWDDVWLADSPLNQVYPRLYLLEADKQSSVATKLSDPTISASFRRPPRGGIRRSISSSLLQAPPLLFFLILVIDGFGSGLFGCLFGEISS
nr:RNA-directed DNA polymerase, eukaryota, reverse transcriptase zinc-binding domain protein [Tanacetum cinerariifolium]